MPTLRLRLDNVSSRYGAPMGRADRCPVDPDAPLVLRLARLRWEDGDYDQGGAYWGCGAPMWCAWSVDAPPEGDEPVRIYVRARTADAARAVVLERFPAARFVGAVRFDVKRRRPAAV